jgi:hypothetical protein
MTAPHVALQPGLAATIACRLTPAPAGSSDTLRDAARAGVTAIGTAAARASDPVAVRLWRTQTRRPRLSALDAGMSLADVNAAAEAARRA